MLHNSNIVLLVGFGDYGQFSSKNIVIWATNKNSILYSSPKFSSEIIIAKINKIRMIIAERNYLHIYSTGYMKVLHIYEKVIISDCSIIPFCLHQYASSSNRFVEGLPQLP